MKRYLHFGAIGSLAASRNERHPTKYRQTATKRRILVEDHVDSVCFSLERLTVQVSGAPPILVKLEEVNLQAVNRPSGVGEPTSTFSDWRIQTWKQ